MSKTTHSPQHRFIPMTATFGMVAAIVVLVLFAGLIAALLRGPGGQSGVGGAVTATAQATTPSPTMPSLSPQQRGAISLAEAQKQVSYHLAEPTWLPSYLVAQGVLGITVDGQMTEPVLYFGPPDGKSS